MQEVSKFDVSTPQVVIRHMRHFSRQILGDLVTKGSVYVLFDEGNKSKWVPTSVSRLAFGIEIRPADLDKLLRRPGEATALGPSPMPPGDASPSARGPDNRRVLTSEDVLDGSYGCSPAQECPSGGTELNMKHYYETSRSFGF